MRGPRSITESVSSLQDGRFSTTASINGLSLGAGYVGLSDESRNKLHMDKRPSRFGHQSSTRGMVERYERMCTPSPDANRSRRGYEVRAHPSRGDDAHGETLVKKDKNKSPLRQSIRNLLSTLKKGAGKSGEVVSVAKGVRKHDTVGLNLERPPRVPEKDRTAIVYPAFSTKPSGEQLAEIHRLPMSQAPDFDHNRAEFSGLIWYLSQTSDATVAWNLCNGVIKGRKLSVTWFNHSDSNHRVLEVDLSRCIDVRSLTSSDMDQEDLAVLNRQEETRDLKVLELVSRGRETDRFAVRNFGERAAWITALWDSIIPTAATGQSSFGSHKELAQGSGQLEDERRPLHIARTTTLPAAPTRVVTNVGQERSLPPLPPQTPRMLPPLTIPPTSLISKVDIMPRIDSARTPSPSVYSPGSLPPPGLPSPATSPSVTDLGRRYMVKQRLAELEKVEEDRYMSSPSPKRTSGSLSPFSPVSTTGTGRSGFLSVLTSEEGAEPDDVEGHVPFEHLRESRFLTSPEVRGGTVEDRTAERPVIERHESTRSELPYANDESPPDSNRPAASEHLKPILDDISTIKSHIGCGKREKTLHQLLLGVDDRSRSTKQTVEQLVRKFESLQTISSPPPSSCKETREVLEATRVDLSNKVDALIKHIRSIDKTPKDTKIEIGPSDLPSSVATKADLGALKEHLDGRIATHMSSLRGQVPLPSSTDFSELSKLRALIENGDGQRALQVQQQADSVRYLNELNAWLENFVRNGTAQINGLATNVERLCKDLGSEPESSCGILNDIYTMLLQLRNRTDSSTLQYSVDRLAETINASSQNTMNMQAFASFMERQRQDQETFLQAFTAEISGEIKGERLRFVEAMKEATAINIQMQVDQLKKELARQIVIVAQDLGRLEAEKREVETKIVNLHAFHANQKQNSGQPIPLTVTANRQTYRPLSRQPQYPAYAAYSQNRPLPYPH